VPDCKGLVRSKGLEPSRLAALPPQGSASTNSATTARHGRPLLANSGSGNKRRHSRAGQQAARPGSSENAAPGLAGKIALYIETPAFDPRVTGRLRCPFTSIRAWLLTRRQS
jgi:hypothetical protein